ncbi:unnamed protein product [Adineta ricciae]|uniref:Transporter n=1 Tax=Adineta ricciae TaxID=249248 RepID=A0A814YQJ5_ADIRI|nr:unnamed protein product [Adineta ricciae]
MSKDKHEWDRPLEFILSLISNSVGLGNVWRFPYLAAKSGGGAFLVPYFILYFLIGAPIYYLELALGQFSSRGPATAFILAKGWQGIGFAMVINTIFCMLYYNVIISWALFYFVLSFRKNLLWKTCGYWWNDDRCFVPGSESSLHVINGTTYNCTQPQYQNMSQYSCVSINATDRVTATEQFFYRLLLGKSNSFEEFGTPQLYPALSLFVAWLIVGACIIRGVKSSGKVAYFTAIFPYVVLLILIIQSSLLHGAIDGIKFYVIPRWELVAKFETWQAAASQVFFSLGLSFGSLMAYSASNKFKNNFFRQMCVVVSCDCFTGIFAGFAVFATIGYLAAQVKESVASYASSSGPGLAFITYAEAITHMPASPVFSILFFLMLLALGLGTQFAMTNIPISAVMELFPRLPVKRPVIVIITCVVSFLVSLPFTCPGGIYLFDLLNEYAANISLVVVGFFQIVVVAYIYGFNRFMNDVKMMLGKRAAEYYLFVTWCIIAPVLIVILTLSKLASSKLLEHGDGGGFAAYVFPEWSHTLGWFIFVICVIPIPLVFVVNYIKEYRSIERDEATKSIGPESREYLLEEDEYLTRPRYLEAFKRNNLPRDDWGPLHSDDHHGLYRHLNDVASISEVDFDLTRPSVVARLDNQNFEANVSD